jgi:protein phosphatase
MTQTQISTETWHAASVRGPRRINADATAAAFDVATGRWAFVVADGVGDHVLAARAASLAARTAADAAAVDGALAGMLAAHRAVTDTVPTEGDCVLAIAVVEPDGTSCDIAWVGDCRVYYSSGGALTQLTEDHTVAEYFRARNAPVTPRMAHLVTTSARTLRPELVGRTRTEIGDGRLLLCSDGMYRPMPAATMQAILRRQADVGLAAGDLVETAVLLGGRDNCTALVVDNHPPASARIAA